MSARPGEGENRARVARRGREGNVADNRRDAEDVRLPIGAGVEEREGVVDAGVDVKDQRLGALSHGDIFPGGAAHPCRS